MDLYIAPPQLEKNASEVTLPENPNAWPTEILQELYKQVPFVSDFDPQVSMDRVDAERGYAFGHIEVQSRTELQQGASEQAQQALGVQHVRIPVIIKDRKLQPFDVIITSDSKSLPLTEGRMRQALFRPQAFDVTSRTPGDMSMVGQLYPPYRQNFGGGGGGGGSVSVGMGKDASADFHDAMQRVLGLSPEEVAKLKSGHTPPVKTQELGKKAAANVPNSTSSTPTGPLVKDIVPKQKHASSMLLAIMPTIEEQDYQQFLGELGDPGVQAAYVKNAAALAPVLQRFEGFTPSGTSKTAAALNDLLVPTVVQVQKLATGYSVKTASHHFWAPKIQAVDRGYVARTYGAKVAAAADEAGSVTLAEPGVKDETPESKPEVISSFGVYRVKDTQGQELVGFVFPNLLDVEGTALPVSLFTNGSVSALQASIVGESVGKDSGLVFGPTKGHGAFVRQLPNGSVDAMIPMTTQGGYSEGGAQKTRVETFDGREMFISVQPNIQAPVMQEDTCLIPEGFKWMSLADGETTLAETPEEWGQTKQASRALASVRVRAGDNSFSLEGFQLQKLGSCDFLSLDDALFLLAGMGTDLDYASEKLAESLAHSRPVDIRIGRLIKTAGTAQQEAVDSAMARLEGLPNLRVSLVKEAGYVPDPLAVDTVLSVGFINPENIMTFVSYLPQMDEAQSHLCELLIASRLGLSDVPTSSLEKCIKSLEGVIEGLRVLAFQKA